MRSKLVRISVVMLLLTAAVSSPAFYQKPSEKLTDWTLLQVPGTWEENSSDIHKEHLTQYDGYAWYRCLVTLPRSWKDKDLQLHVEKVDNAHEAYFNGQKIGGAGSFPPSYKSGLDQSKRYTVPAKLLKTGENLISIRVYDKDGKGGFKGAAPTLISEKTAINLNGAWEFNVGDDVAWAKGPVKLTDTGIFWRVLETKIALQNAKSDGALTPEEALQMFAISDDLELEQVLAEPISRQPLFMNFDERGRMWLVQYLQYPSPAGLKMVSKDQYWRAVYDKIPPPPPNHFRGADKITIHEDTDGDGQFDKHKTFLDGLNIATSCERGRGGVWVLNPPYLLFYPDRNNDDIPDSDPEVHLQGFGMEDTHSVVNNLRWGPDGWLYAAQGSTVSGNVIRPGLDKKPIHSMGQLIWRYHPEKKIYEIFAEGGGNSHGVEIDEKGRIYSGHNGGNTRGFHYVQGGYYRKGFTKHGPLSNPYSFGFFEAMKHHAVPRFTHNFILYAGAALPDHYNGKLFGVEPMQGRIVQSDFKTDRSSFQTKDINRPISTSDRRFRPVNIAVGPDGAIYVADMYEPQISHREHFSGQITKNDGRVYRLKAKGAKPHQVPDLSKKSSRELVDFLAHPNKWYRQTVLRLLGDRKDKSILPLLKQQIANNTDQLALESLWALNVSGGFNDDVALQLLDHEDQYVRAWTVRLLCDEKKISKRVSRKLADLASREAYVHVRSQLASSAKRLPAEDALPIIRNLLTHNEDVDDIHLPLLLWWASESKADSGRELIIEMFQDKKLWNLPLVQKHLLQKVIQRYAMAGSRKDLLTCARLFELSPGKEQSAELMKGFELAYKGRSLAGLPVELSRELSKAGGGSLSFRVRQGDSHAIDEALKTIANPKSDKNTRVEYAQVFGEVSQPISVPVLLETLPVAKDDQLQMTILTSLQSYNNPEIGADVVKQYGSLSEDARAAAQTLLVSRSVWNRQFLKAIDAGTVNKKTIPLDTVRMMTIHQDEQIASLVKKHWKSVEGASSAEMQKQMAHMTDVLKSGSGDPYRGKELFNKSCGKCHLLFGQGGRIGPDLTSYKRDDTLRFLLNVVNPSAEVREGFETFLILTEDGRTVSGFLFDQDSRVIVLRGADGQNITIRKDAIEEQIPQKKSLMPEGLLKDLSEQQVRDLFAYLKSSQPLNN